MSQRLKVALDRIAERHQEVFWECDAEPAEAIVGFRALIWGLWSLNPWLAMFSSNPLLWRVAGRWAPEWVWGVWFTGVGAGVLLLLAFGNVQQRRQLQFLHFLTWVALAVAQFAASPHSGGPVQHLFTAAICGWVYLRVGRRRASAVSPEEPGHE